MNFDLKKYDVPGESPFYTDFLYHVQEDYPDAGIKYTLEHLTVFEQEEIPYLYSHSTQLIESFNMIYKYHEIGSETEDRWQYQIDKKFMEIKRRYERYFMMYETNAINQLGKILSENATRSGTSGKTYSNESKNVFQDTPVTPLIENANYATNITDNTGNGEDTGEFEEEYESTKTDKDKSNLELVNQNVKIWNDLIIQFTDEFRTCFMDELTRI